MRQEVLDFSQNEIVESWSDNFLPDFNAMKNEIMIMKKQNYGKKYNGSLRDYSNVYYTNDCGHVADVYSVVKMLENNEFMTGSDIKLDGGLTNLFEI